MVLPKVKRRRPVRPRSIQWRMRAIASGAKTSVENTPVNRLGCAATASAT